MFHENRLTIHKGPSRKRFPPPIETDKLSKKSVNMCRLYHWKRSVTERYQYRITSLFQGIFWPDPEAKVRTPQVHFQVIFGLTKSRTRFFYVNDDCTYNNGFECFRSVRLQKKLGVNIFVSGTRGKNEKHQFRPDDNYDEVRFKLQSFHTRVVVAEVVVVVVVVVVY